MCDNSLNVFEHGGTVHQIGVAKVARDGRDAAGVNRIESWIDEHAADRFPHPFEPVHDLRGLERKVLRGGVDGRLRALHGRQFRGNGLAEQIGIDVRCRQHQCTDVLGVLALFHAAAQRAGDDAISHAVRDDVDLARRQLRQLAEQLLEGVIGELRGLLVLPIGERLAGRGPAVEEGHAGKLQIVRQLRRPERGIGKARIVAVHEHQ